MLKAVTIAGLSLLLIISSLGVSFAQDEESFVRESVISKRDAVVLSALFPGLGQMTSGQKVRGVSLFLAEAASLVLFVNAHENYSTKKTTYDSDLEDFNKIATTDRGSYTTALQSYDDLKDQQKKLDDLHNTRNIALIVAAGVYAYNLVDVIFFTPSSSESRRAQNGSNRIEVNSVLVDRAPGIMLTKRF
ncbi:MAG: hypothetical protein JXB48_08790 [Candidatus Latescibacteria bacterium]|nr:hypothetical protein [Candidatus Latescibacterota bacterium]